MTWPDDGIDPMAGAYFAAAKRMGITQMVLVDGHETEVAGEVGRWGYAGASCIKVWIPQAYARMEHAIQGETK